LESWREGGRGRVCGGRGRVCGGRGNAAVGIGGPWGWKGGVGRRGGCGVDEGMEIMAFSPRCCTRCGVGWELGFAGVGMCNDGVRG
jgi:hypothetical protein